MPDEAVLFDFDGTLCPGDSIVPWLRFCIHAGAAPRWQWLPAAGGYLRQRLNPARTVSAKETTLSFIQGRTEAEFTPLASRFMAECIAPRIHPEARQLMDELHRDGMKIVVISASPDLYMRCLKEILPVDGLLATVCETDRNGVYTGRITSNCRGGEKVRRWEARNRDRGWRPARAYGDSIRDLPMLSLAETPFLVNPDAALCKALPQACILRWPNNSVR